MLKGPAHSSAPGRDLLRTRGTLFALAALVALWLLGGCDVQKTLVKIPVGGYWERLTPAADSICFFPDWRGDRVLFTVKLSLGTPLSPQFYRVGLIRADGTGNKVYPGGPQSNDYAPRWVNDSLAVLFSNRGGSFDIWYLDLNSQTFRSLGAIAGDQVSPAPRPGSPGLAYVEAKTTNLDGRIALIPDTATAFMNVRYLTPDSIAAGEPDWDPTGTRVCFSAVGPDKVRHIWLVTIGATDTTLTQLTTGSDSDENPRMSPDGSKIVFYSERDGRPGIWEVSIAGESAGLRPVAAEDPGTFLGTPAWSPDGHALVAGSNGRIFVEQDRQQALWKILNAFPQNL